MNASSLLSQAVTRTPRLCFLAKWRRSRGLQTVPRDTIHVPLRKHLKDAAKRQKTEARAAALKGGKTHERKEKWELTVGVEIHAELNTACKLFSNAPTITGGATPNNNVAVFDAALPGTQPQFQIATLLPALRAAIALGCEVRRKSTWDRKHYFHWDQPNGYQITQYYEPFANNGKLTLTADDGVPSSDLQGAESLDIGIKQIQMEQDTAKTTVHHHSIHHIDLNRAGHPLIEIITLPHIHSPQTAAAVVRKIQAVLKSVNSCITGMELGGLRADVNVSIRERGTSGVGASYSGVSGLGQRTEIKNLSSFKAVEDAITAEWERQIEVLESGGMVESETRGWTLGAKETTRLRGKEGEIDYRYMPDADLPPLLIDPKVVEHLRSSLPELPERTVARIQRIYGVSLKDAKTLVALDSGDRLEFMEEAVRIISDRTGTAPVVVGKLVSNWVLHELGGLLSSTDNNSGWETMPMSPQELADVLTNLLDKQITARAAKQLIVALLGDNRHAGDQMSVDEYINHNRLRLRPLSEAGYMELAQKIMASHPEMVKAVQDKGQKGKVMWFVGQMIRQGEEGTVEPDMAKQIIEKMLLYDG